MGPLLRFVFSNPPKTVRRPYVVRPILAASCAWLASTMPASAHDPMSSWTIVQLRPEVIEIEVVFAPSEAYLLVQDAATGIKNISYENFPFVRPLLVALGPELIKVTVGDAVLAPTTTTVVMTPEDDIQFNMTYARPPPGVVGFDALFLNHVSVEHMTYVSVVAEDGTFLAGSEPIVGETKTFVDLPPPQAPVPADK